ALQCDVVFGGELYRRADELRRNWKLTATAIYQRRESYARGPAVVEELVHRGSYGAPRVEHIVDQYQIAPFHLEGHVRALDLALESLAPEIVAIKGHVERAEGHCQFELPVQPLGKPCTAGHYAHQPGLRRHLRTHLLREIRERLFRVGYHRVAHG